MRFRNLLSDTAARCTVILSTHIVEDIGHSCNDVVSTLQTMDGVQYRVLGFPAAHYDAKPVEPSLEDGYIWLMSQTSRS